MIAGFQESRSSRDAPPSVSLTGARLSFGGQVLFDDLDFDLAGGEWTCLLGPSGVGKTTLLRLIAGLVPAENGARVTCGDGQPIGRRVAYMGQQDLLFPWLTLVENVTIGFRLRRETGPEAERRARGLLDDLGLGDRANSLPASCSGGMRQRAALARTLFEDRPIVLMDEPFSALDAITRIRLQELAGGLLAGRTVLLVTHDPLEALRLGHRIVIMSGTPVTLGPAPTPPGAPPRNLEDPIMLTEQGKLLGRLARAGSAAP